MNFLVNFIIIGLFIFPFVAFIHEIGHAFFLKLFGGKINGFSIGNGKILWKKNNFNIRNAYFAGGRVVPNTINGMSTTQKSFFFLGGVLFNLISALVLDVTTGYELGVFRHYLDSFIFVSYLNVFINLVPLTTIFGDTDGKKLVELYKR
ncbi:hypothetical protein FQ085_05845 [Planococcus sp. ANT_H30]|uniref:site-2 protease family protein n=1 Tax=Planococcus sp. ANT_H30 TaxID=2597347 RepID=UPI0011EC75F3|nr:site-2 protease family protein [Planococcus sp. ANT_H30]KAA0957579.1 hypothetical protein FQ085_05845 [Planococcus sp. ANT_H30]